MRVPSRVFFVKAASLSWLLCWLCLTPWDVLGANGSGWTRQSDAQQRLPGQTAPKRAALQGLVRGANGRAVVGVMVILRNLTSGQSFEKVSNAQGVFRFIEVLPGNYELRVVATGFEDFANSDVQLKPGDNLVCEVTLIANPSAAAQGRQFPHLPAAATTPQAGPQPAPLLALRPQRYRTKISNSPGRRLP